MNDPFTRNYFEKTLVDGFSDLKSTTKQNGERRRENCGQITGVKSVGFDDGYLSFGCSAG
jgi:hypothetical protein